MGRCMALAGAKIVLVGRRKPPLVEACEQIGPRAVYELCDITDFAAAESLISRISRQFGPISILANNAGIHLKRTAVQTTVQEFQEVLNVHVLAAHNLVRIILPTMIDRRRGNILFIASMASLFGVPLVVAYAAAKSAYLGMVRSLANEVSSHGVRVNAIAPGWIESPILRQALANDEKRAQQILNRTPMRRFGEPDDIGWAAVYLCSPAATFVTGAVLPIDGGASIGF